MSKLYQPIEGTITRLNDEGEGVIEQPEKRPILVANTLPGERVEAVPFKRTKEGLEADISAVIEPSVHRVTPVCPYATVCGGCRWQHIDYDFQVQTKRDLVDQAFAEAHLDVKVDAIIASEAQLQYRNRMDYTFGSDGQLGLKMPGRWWDVLDLETCFLLSEQTPMILKRVREWTKASGLPFWNVRTHEGFFRYLVIREGKNTGERLIMLTTSDKFTLNDEQKKSFVDLLDDVTTSILIGVNDTITDLSIPGSIETLKGKPFLHETVNGLTYRIQPASFFQTNTMMAAKLQDAVIEACGEIKNKRLLDLYCGAGFFSLALAKQATDVIGVEIDEAAIRAADENAELNGIKNTRFIASKAETFDWVGENPDVVIIDPPRAGLHPSVIETLTKALPERIVYVSCKYQKLIEELPAFLEHYRVESVRALDLFPQTPHVEIVVSLIKL